MEAGGGGGESWISTSHSLPRASLYKFIPSINLCTPTVPNPFVHVLVLSRENGCVCINERAILPRLPAPPAIWSARHQPVLPGGTKNYTIKEKIQGSDI